MSYRQLMNSFDLQGLDLLQVSGEIDFSDATLVGFPVDEVTIRINPSGVLELMNGSVTIAKVTGTDLWTRILSDETNIATALSRTQYQSATGNVTTFTGTISVPALLLNGTNVLSLLITHDTAIGALQSITQNQSRSGTVTSFTGSISVPALTLNGTDLNTRLVSIESLNTTQTSRLNGIDTLNATQDSRLTAIEGVNVTQDSRLTAIEGVNANQDLSILTLQAKTQNIFASELLTQISGSLLIPDSLTFKGVDLNVRIGNIETVNTTQDSRLTAIEAIDATQTSNIDIVLNRTQNFNFSMGPNTTIDGIVTFSGSIFFSGSNLNTRITSIETLNTTQDSRLDNLESKTQYIVDASSFVTLFSGSLQVSDSVSAVYMYLNGVNLNVRIGNIETKTLHLSTSVVGPQVYTNVNSHLNPVGDSVWFLGDVGKRWGSIYGNAGFFDSMLLNGSDLDIRITDIETVNTTQDSRLLTLETKTQYQSATGLITSWACDLNPTVDNIYDLGSPAKEWKRIYTHELYVDSIVLDTVGGNLSLGSSIVPNATNTYDLGTTANRWRTLIVQAITLNGTDLNTRITSTETNVTALQTKTQYQSAAANVTTFTGTLNANTPLFNTTQLLLNGQEFFFPGNTSTSGIALLLGVNRTGNRQLWIGDSALARNTTNVNLRIIPGSSAASIDGISTDGTVGGKDVNIACGNGVISFANTTKNKKLALYDATLNEHQFYGLGISSASFRFAIDSAGASYDFFYATSSTTSTQILKIAPAGLYLYTSYAEKTTGTTWANPSDSRIKKNIIRDKSKLPGLKEINQLELTQWEFNEDAESSDDKPHIGFIAEEVERVFPSACCEMPHKKFGTIKGLDCSDLLMSLFPAVQELSAKLDAALARIKILEEEVGFAPDPKRPAI